MLIGVDLFVVAAVLAELVLSVVGVVITDHLLFITE